MTKPREDHELAAAARLVHQYRGIVILACGDDDEAVRFAEQAFNRLHEAVNRRPSPVAESTPSPDTEGVRILADQTGAPGRVEVGPDDPFYRAFRPSPETIAAIERDERANAQGLAAIRDMMIGHVTNWPDPKKFGTAISLVDKTLRAALRTAQNTGRDEVLADELHDLVSDAYQRGYLNACEDCRHDPRRDLMLEGTAQFQADSAETQTAILAALSSPPVSTVDEEGES